MKTDYADFLEWLEDHNYCKVVPCAKCYFWGEHHGTTCHELNTTAHNIGEKKINRCRFHKVNTWADDFCSNAIVFKGGQNAGKVQ